MDERLVGQFDWIKGIPDQTNLCVYAVLLARIDRDEPTSTEVDEWLNLYLAHVLSFWFRPIALAEILEGNFFGLINRLNEPLLPPQRRRIAQKVGDQLLFFTSQHGRVGRTRPTSLSFRSMIGIGSGAYSQAAANTQARRDVCHYQIFARLASEWPNFQALLDNAGHILGYDLELSNLVAGGRLVATFEDVLAAIATFGKEPSAQNWDLMADVVHRREWTDLGFRYHLPPRPKA